VGVPESEVQKAAEIELKRRGAIREVETMCQSGIRTLNHRAFGANWKKIEENDLVMIDIGCVYKGYGSDLTRTWCVGKPTNAYKKIVDDIVRTREKVLDIMKPGVTLGEITELGRNEMKNAGYSIDKFFLPSNGVGWGYLGIHGIGLGPMHDPPHVSDKGTALESGMTIAYTGGVRDAKFTIRFEDDMVIVPGGFELINKQLPWQL
ncbi:M24 family metallopeptidase, partial [Chloroflexota bacterium]